MIDGRSQSRGRRFIVASQEERRLQIPMHLQHVSWSHDRAGMRRARAVRALLLAMIGLRRLCIAMAAREIRDRISRQITHKKQHHQRREQSRKRVVMQQSHDGATSSRSSPQVNESGSQEEIAWKAGGIMNSDPDSVVAAHLRSPRRSSGSWPRRR